MDAFTRHQPHPTGICGGTPSGQLPGCPRHHYCGPNSRDDASCGQTSEFLNVASLWSRVSALKLLLAECQKENTEAQSVIAYLLKLNARSSFHGAACDVNQAPVVPHNENGMGTEGAMKDILAAMTALLHKMSDIGHTNCDQPSTHRTNEVCGDLLGDLDEQPSLEVQHTKFGYGGKEDPPGHILTPSGHTQDVVGKRDVKEEATSISQELTVTAEGQLLLSESDGFLQGPYIRRFCHTRARRAAGVEDFPLLQPEVHSKQTESASCSFDESGSSISGSTQYGGIDNGSTSLSSISSSFHEPDIDLEARILRCSDDASRETDLVSKDFKFISGAPIVDDIQGTSAPEVATIEAFTSDSISPRSAIATLFLPRWPAQPFTVSSSERERAIYVHQRVAAGQEHAFPDLFRYGIRFCPDPNESDIYRTVVVDNLPPDIVLSALLRHIKGGALLDAKLLDTTNIDGHLTATIEFVHEYGARIFERRARQVPLLFAGVRARVALLPTPTWPMSLPTRMAVMEHGHTRCLEIHNLPYDISPSDLKRDLRVYHAMPNSHRIESMEKQADGVVKIRFTSVNFAGRAYGILTTHSRYRRCHIKRSPDPCAEPWDTIPERPEVATTPVAAIHKDDPCTANAAAVFSWKEFALSNFAKDSDPKLGIYGDVKPDERAGRLGVVELDDIPEIQRGRGIQTEDSALKESEGCNPQ
ncbi:MAG: hypothetical protein Q9201_001154 [Fulgogasparrea decipioides]